MSAIYKWDMPEARDKFRAKLKSMVCDEFGISEQDLSGARSFHNIVNARSFYATLARKYCNDTLIRIGIDLNKKHTSVMHFIKRLEDYTYTNKNMRKRFEEFETELITNL